MGKTGRVLVCDANNLSFRCFISMYESGNTLSNNVGVPTTVTFGLLRMLNAFTSSFSVDRCVVCWDGGSKYRKKLYKWYKHNRAEKPDWVQQYYDELNATREAFERLGIQQASIRGIEADDIIGYLAAKVNETGKRTIIMSDDKDFFQLSKMRVRYYRPTSMKLIGRDDADEILDYSSWLLPRVTAFTGEQKDNIPGAAATENHLMKKVGIGPKKALAWLNDGNNGWLSVKKALDSMDRTDRFYSIVQENRKQVMKSYLLSRIRTKDSQYEKWELGELVKCVVALGAQCTVSRKVVGQMHDFLNFRTIKLAPILNNLGVRVT